jgi:hypothetical protein
MEYHCCFPHVITISELSLGTFSGWVVIADGTTLVEMVSLERAISHVLNVINHYVAFMQAQYERVHTVATNQQRTTRISTGRITSGNTNKNSPTSQRQRISDVTTSKHARLTDLVDSSLPQRLFNKAISEHFGDDEFAITWVADNVRLIDGPFGQTELVDATLRELDSDGDPTGDEIEVSFSGPYIINMLKRLTKGREYRGILIAQLVKRPIEGTNNQAWMLV